MKETWREGSFSGDPKRYVKALEMGVCFHTGPAFGKHGGVLLGEYGGVLLGNMEGHFWGIWRGAFGEYGGVLFLRVFERKKFREIFV
jgi:hypothetical protein